MSVKMLKAVMVGVILSVSGFANAGLIINFNDISSNFRFQNLPSYDEAGYNISVSCSNCSNVFTGNRGWGASGSFLETWNNDAIYTLTNISGANFNFTGFDMGWYNNDTGNAYWNIRAYDKDGLQIGTQDSYTGKGSVSVDYTNVSSIQFQNNGPRQRGTYSSFDNLAVSTIPEPTTLAIFALGLMGLAVRNTKK